MSSTFETFEGYQNEAVSQMVKAAGDHGSADKPGVQEVDVNVEGVLDYGLPPNLPEVMRRVRG